MICLMMMWKGNPETTRGGAKFLQLTFQVNGAQHRVQKSEFKRGIKEGETGVVVLYFRHIY